MLKYCLRYKILKKLKKLSKEVKNMMIMILIYISDMLKHVMGPKHLPMVLI